MGIKKLGPFLRKLKLDTAQPQLAAYAGLKFAIDTPIFMYKFRANRPEQYLDQFAKQLRMFKNLNITPIYVFDGKPTHMKRNELQCRQQKKQTIHDIANNTTLPFCERVTAYEKMSAMPKREHYDALRAFLHAQGVSVIESESDAEKQCAFMSRTGQCDVVVSEDFDALCYGATRLLTRLTLFPEPRTPMREYRLETILASLKFTHAQFLDFCLLCGSDLCSKIPNIGPARALTFIRAHRKIEDVVKYINRDQYPIPATFEEDVRLARAEFLGESSSARA